MVASRIEHDPAVRTMDLGLNNRLNPFFANGFDEELMVHFSSSTSALIRLAFAAATSAAWSFSFWSA